MLTKIRQHNPVWLQCDPKIREMLSSEVTPESDRDAILADQIERLWALKTTEDPQWQEVRQPRVELQVVQDVLNLGVSEIADY